MSEYPGDEDCGWILSLLVVALAIALIVLGINISATKETQEPKQEYIDTEINILENRNGDMKYGIKIK